MKQNITTNVQSELFDLPDAKPVLNAGAEFSECGLYRYKLWRIWDENKPLAMCIGLNPSTANAHKNDTTITYLTKMLGILGYGGFYMMNCFSYITSKPELLQYSSWHHYNNLTQLKTTSSICKDVIFAWGCFRVVKNELLDVELKKIFPKALCFGRAKDGSPIHPLAMMPRNGRDPNNPKLIPYDVGSTCI